MSLEGYIKHAKRYGTTEVFETAKEEGVSLKDLVKLAIELHAINRKWRMDREDAHWLVCALAGKVDSPKLAKAAGVTTATVEKWQLTEIEYVVVEETA